MAREAKVRLSSVQPVRTARKLTRPTHADLAARCDQAARPRDAQTDLSLLAGPGSSGKSTILVRFFGFSCGSPPLLTPDLESLTEADEGPSSTTPSASDGALARRRLTLALPQILHLSGFTPAELEEYRQQIFVNVREAMRACLAVLETEGFELAQPALLVRFDLSLCHSMQEADDHSYRITEKRSSTLRTCASGSRSRLSCSDRSRRCGWTEGCSRCS